MFGNMHDVLHPYNCRYSIWNELKTIMHVRMLRVKQQMTKHNLRGVRI